jgi:myo-inositol-1-phosphate synthase
VSKIRVAIVGVGNCANSLVQGVTYYKDAAIDQEIPGLMHANLGGYHISDIEFVGAYDVDAKKVGLNHGGKYKVKKRGCMTKTRYKGPKQKYYGNNNF